MRAQGTQQAMQIAKLTACAFILAQGLVALTPLAAGAQFAQPLGVQSGGGQPYTTIRNPLIPGASYAPPGSPAPQGQPEIPGDGQTPNPVTPGDAGYPTPPPSDTADMTHGNIFPAGTGYDRTTIIIQRQNNNGRGTRVVQTLRPDSLTPQQQQQVMAILGVNPNSGEADVTVTATDSQLAQIQNILNPYPNAQIINGRTTITTDSPGPNANINKPQNQSIYQYQGPLPTVKTFARYLVLMGVVAATVWMALAAYSVVLGNPYGGARVISAAAGLMTLLAAYTIWKIVQMNTFHANSATPGQVISKAGGGQVSDAYLNPPNLPITPNGGRQQPQRSGIPLVPFGDALQN